MTAFNEEVRPRVLAQYGADLDISLRGRI
jgi:hypothetical protein